MKIYLSCVYEKVVFEPLGIEAIYTFLKRKGYDVELVMIDGHESIDASMQHIGELPDMMGFYVANTSVLYTYRLAEEIKRHKRDTKIFVGGPFATLCKEFILRDCESIDFVVLGDGELPIQAILDHYEKKHEILNEKYVYQRGDLAIEKEAYRLTAEYYSDIQHDLLYKPEYRYVYIAYLVTGRGCCAHCAFCCHNFYSDKNISTWRGRRSPQDVFDEVIHIYQQHGIRIMSFNDSSFEDAGWKGKQFIDEFCDLLLAYPVKFSIIVTMRAESFKERDLPLLQKMKKAGFRVLLGIESMDEEMLRVYHKIAKVEDNMLATQLFEQEKIDISLGFIMINPKTTMESLRKNFDYLIQHKIVLTRLYGNTIEIYYGSKMYKEFTQEGILNDTYDYLRIKDYHYVNEKIARIVEVLEKTEEEVQIYGRENDFQTFELLYNSILDFNDLKETEDAHIFDDVKDMLLVLIQEYYGKLFFEFDTFQFEQEVTSYKERIHKIYDMIDSLKRKAMKKRFVLKYLQEREEAYLRNQNERK